MSAPIDELEYFSGVKVVDIGDLRVSRGKTRRPASVCGHKRVSYDRNERRIWCRDCEQDIEAFDAFEHLVTNYSSGMNSLLKREQQIAEAEQHNVRSIAAKVMDEAWRSRTMVPACPQCGHGLFPEDFRDGIKSRLGRDYALKRREAARASGSKNT
jgi:hypothetical protein